MTGAAEQAPEWRVWLLGLSAPCTRGRSRLSGDQCHAPECTVKRQRGGRRQLADDKRVSIVVGPFWHVCA